ncbi:family 16 glycosylhydrolase [Algibacter agarivorans]|uniref:Family 16 glycosylhydrolase n=1 Tax=Algibacter agarivorans TaxID=1109741 RepID=A0ABP9GA93_9FLAO
MKSINTLFLVAIGILFFSCSASQDTTSQSGTNENQDLVIKFNNGVIAKSIAKNYPELNQTWQIEAVFSDEFNYEGKNSEFEKNWNDTYFNGWRGPGLTEWTSNNSDVKNGNLIISASRKPNTNRVYCGVITSKKEVKYPIYTEVRAKIANQVLSSNFWFLSKDDKRELDIIECYGGDRDSEKWFAANAASNTHVFLRNDSDNSIIKDINKSVKHKTEDGSPWRNDFHTYGAYWKDAFTIDIYYDGKLVNKIRKESINDPENVGLNRKMFLIIDLEDHDWRSRKNPPITPTDEELKDESKNKYFIDYVRTFRPINKN